MYSSHREVYKCECGGPVSEMPLVTCSASGIAGHFTCQECGKTYKGDKHNIPIESSLYLHPDYLED